MRLFEGIEAEFELVNGFTGAAGMAFRFCNTADVAGAGAGRCSGRGSIDGETCLFDRRMDSNLFGGEGRKFVEILNKLNIVNLEAGCLIPRIFEREFGGRRRECRNI